jgi:tetratricopeptide (TPR) repeat protein
MMSLAKDRLLAFVLPVLVGIAFANGVNGSFQFDDWEVIVADSRVQTLHAWWGSMPGIRPLLKLSYAVNHEYGAGPAGFRLTNIVLHGLNCILLFAVLRRLGNRMVPNDPAKAQLAAVTACVVFAVHPVQTESVTYISGRSNVLMALFALATLYCWLRAGGEHGRRRCAWNGASLAALLLAAASKETALITPLALWLCWACLPLMARELAPRPWPPTLLAVAAGIAAVALLPYGYLLEVSLTTRSVFDNLAVQAHAVWYLLGQLLHFERLNADPTLPAVSSLTAGTVWRSLVLAAAMALGLASLRRRPALAFGVLWFFVWLAPTNSLLARLDVVNDRQLYLAIAGPGWLLGLASSALLQGRGRDWSMASVAALAGVLVVGTVFRSRVYANEVVFWEDVVKKSPQNARAANNLGMAYALDCRYEAALQAFHQAERLENGYRAGVNRALLEAGALPGVPPRCKARPQRQ